MLENVKNQRLVSTRPLSSATTDHCWDDHFNGMYFVIWTQHLPSLGADGWSPYDLYVSTNHMADFCTFALTFKSPEEVWKCRPERLFHPLPCWLSDYKRKTSSAHATSTNVVAIIFARGWSFNSNWSNFQQKVGKRRMRLKLGVGLKKVVVHHLRRRAMVLHDARLDGWRGTFCSRSAIN